MSGRPPAATAPSEWVAFSTFRSRIMNSLSTP